eukprot:580177-Rhodomonas_salina.1
MEAARAFLDSGSAAQSDLLVEELEAAQVGAYGPAMRCPVLVYSVWYLPYRLSTPCPVLAWCMAYGLGMRCPVLVQCIVLAVRASYAMSGTDIAYAATQRALIAK